MSEGSSLGVLAPRRVLLARMLNSRLLCAMTSRVEERANRVMLRGRQRAHYRVPLLRTVSNVVSVGVYSEREKYSPLNPFDGDSYTFFFSQGFWFCLVLFFKSIYFEVGKKKVSLSPSLNSSAVSNPIPFIESIRLVTSICTLIRCFITYFEEGRGFQSFQNYNFLFSAS